ncbi:MAG TPA: hypothetical protein VGH44_03925 [Candidatus Saccharimonadia bacterium]|jgi:hypothetical protein
MKQKDLVYLVIAVVIFLVAGYIGYTQLVPKKAGAGSTGVQVEKVGIIPDNFDQTALTELNDPTKVVDYSTPQDFSGLANTAPFGP